MTEPDNPIAAAFAEHQEVARATAAALAEPLDRLIGLTVTALGQGNKLILFGNGGSAADAQHIAAELVGRYINDRPALAAIALTTDTSALTAIANDYGFDHLFARQIEALGRPGDVAIGLSTSGNSPNVLKGLAAARERGLIAVGFGGRGGGRLAEVADPLLVVPSDSTARIQEMHITLGHILCAGIERHLGHSG